MSNTKSPMVPLGSSYDYLDAPLNTGASDRNPENVQQLCFPVKKQNTK